MRTLYCFVIFFASTLCAEIPIEQKLSDLPTGYTYRLLGDKIIELTDDFGVNWRLDLSDINISVQDTSDHKIIKIALIDVDTTDFHKRMNHLMTLPIGLEDARPIAGDSDNDGLIELVGYHSSDQPNSASTQIYERVSNGSNSFQSVFTYPWLMKPLFTADVNSNGKIEYWFRKTRDHQDDYFAYESLSNSGLAILPIIHFFRGGANFSYPRTADFDNDGRQDMVHNGGDGHNYFEAVAEYDPSTKAMSNVWRHPSISSPVGHQWSVGDIDRDGKMEFINGHMKGIVFWYEHDGENDSYQQVFFDTLFYKNAYYNTEGDDIDGDFHMEVFLGGAGYYQDIWTNFITCFESVGKDKYERKVELWIRGMGGWNPSFIQQADIDGDGINELVWSAGFSVAVIKNTGDDDYEIWWYKHFDRWIGATTADLDYDGDEEILVSYGISVPNSTVTQTEIYAFPDTNTVAVREKESIVLAPHSFVLHPNYPNPFNSRTIIAYELNEPANVRLKVYTTTGKEVNCLLAKHQFPGDYRLVWDGTNALGEQVSTGVYILRLSVDAEYKVHKMLFIQ